MKRVMTLTKAKYQHELDMSFPVSNCIATAFKHTLLISNNVNTRKALVTSKLNTQTHNHHTLLHTHTHNASHTYTHTHTTPYATDTMRRALTHGRRYLNPRLRYVV